MQVNKLIRKRLTKLCLYITINFLSKEKKQKKTTIITLWTIKFFAHSVNFVLFIKPEVIYT